MTKPPKNTSGNSPENRLEMVGGKFPIIIGLPLTSGDLWYNSLMGGGKATASLTELLQAKRQKRMSKPQGRVLLKTVKRDKPNYQIIAVAKHKRDFRKGATRSGRKTDEQD